HRGPGPAACPGCRRVGRGDHHRRRARLDAGGRRLARPARPPRRGRASPRGHPGDPGGPRQRAGAGAGRGRVMTTRVAEHSDKYAELLQLADVFDRSGDELRSMVGLGVSVLRDDAVADSGDLSPASHARAEEDIRAATTGKQGLLSRSIELDADALVVRATVLTYQWIDELRDAAYATLGAVAGRAIGYLAPNVALGGAIVTA